MNFTFKDTPWLAAGRFIHQDFSAALFAFLIKGLEQSATTSRAGGMRMAPGRGQGHLCWWPLIFKKNFLISVLSDLSVLMTT
jgi:hypothetical protein